LKSEKVISLLLVLIVSASTLLIINSAHAATAGTISAVQAGTTSSAWSVGPNPNPIGSTLQVDVRIDGASDVLGCFMNVNWNPYVLQLASVNKGSYMGSTGVTWIGNSTSQWDNTKGLLKQGLSCYRTSNPTPPEFSAGILATLRFNVLGNAGTDDITLSNAVLYQAVNKGNPIGVTANNATVTMIPTTPTGVISAVKAGTTNTNSWTLDTSQIGSEVHVDVRIDNAIPKTVWGWALGVNWDSSVLRLTGVHEGNFLEDSEDDTAFIGSNPAQWDQAGGTVMGGLACCDSVSMFPATPDVDGVLASLTFEVVGYGTSGITLSDATLRTYSGDTLGVAVVTTGATVIVPTPTLVSCNSAGAEKSSFNTGATIYVKGSNFPPSTPYYLYVVSHQASMAEFQDLNAIRVTDKTSGATDDSGNIALTNVYSNAQNGMCDLVLDFDQDGFFIPDVDFVASNAFSVSSLPVTNVTLTVSSTHGIPDPSVGSHIYVSGTSVSCSVNSPIVEDGHTYTCIGWAGTGSVPASGTTASTDYFVISDYSTITWNWRNESETIPILLVVSSEHGRPSPTVGGHNCVSGESISCSVNSPVTEYGVTWTCIGWTGTGSAPASGSVPSITFTIATNSSISWNWQQTPTSLDIWTNKGGQGYNVSANAFGPEEQVSITANVTSGGGVSAGGGRQVAFTITYANGDKASSVALTNENGIATTTCRLKWLNPNPASAFGIVTITASVTVAQATANDTCAFMYNYILQTISATITNNDGHTTPSNIPYFSRYTGPQINVNVLIKNINWSQISNDQTSFYLAGTLYDNNNVPVAYQLLPEVISPAVSQTCDPSNSNSASFTLTLSIPRYAYVGSATLYLNIYNDNPAKTGIPFCPEASVQLMIDASQ
jgi:hypothetical protein